MSERKTYVYRLVVELPPEAAEPGFVPEALLSTAESWRDWDDHPFRWPRHRRYLDYESASRRAALLRKWGATVTVERAAATEWEPLMRWAPGDFPVPLAVKETA